MFLSIDIIRESKIDVRRIATSFYFVHRVPSFPISKPARFEYWSFVQHRGHVELFVHFLQQCSLLFGYMRQSFSNMWV